uniref:ENTH domain-containing protein n=1 Tax=Oryzias sinensis TaxID=183150 RepID=A0A8C7WS07_9TELE
LLDIMTSSMLRRQLKNLVQNYSEAEVKVREATSNDPWGPSSSQMADISDLTYNVVACNEIMTMLWKRLKDDKNWRHIHKVGDSVLIFFFFYSLSLIINLKARVLLYCKITYVAALLIVKATRINRYHNMKVKLVQLK